jgi:hypothetical protein
MIDFLPYSDLFLVALEVCAALSIDLSNYRFRWGFGALLHLERKWRLDSSV